MGKNVDLCDKLRDRRYPNSKEKRFVRWKKFFSLLLKIIIIIVSARMLGAILSVENSVVIEDTVVSFIYQFIFRILVAFGVGIIIICGFLCIRCCRQSIPLFYMTNAIYKGEIGHEAFIGYNIIRRDDCELKKIDRWRTLGTLYKGKTADNDYFNINGKIRIVLLSEAEYSQLPHT